MVFEKKKVLMQDWCVVWVLNIDLESSKTHIRAGMEIETMIPNLQLVRQLFQIAVANGY